MFDLYIQSVGAPQPERLAGRNFVDDIAVDDVKAFVAKFRSFLKASTPQLLSTIKSEAKLSDSSEEALKKAIGEAKAM